MTPGCRLPGTYTAAYSTSLAGCSVWLCFRSGLRPPQLPVYPGNLGDRAGCGQGVRRCYGQ
jgi:hypothetical protein